MNVKKIFLFLLIVFSFSVRGYSQCEITSRIDPTKVLYYYAEPVRVFWTESKSLYCGAFTDYEHYYLQFYPEPFPEKSKKKPTKNNAIITLSNNEKVALDFYDSRYISDDTVFVMQYLIPDKSLESFLNKNRASSISDWL